MTDIEKGAAFVWYLVKELRAKGVKQIGKTMVQKLMFLIAKEINEDFLYSMYHYGPYSFAVAQYIDYAEYLRAIKIEWRDEEGFYIKPLKPKRAEFFSMLTENEKKTVKEIVEKYGKFNSRELSVITTAIYLKDNFEVKNIEEIIRIVNSLKPQYTKEQIPEILTRAEVLA